MIRTGWLLAAGMLVVSAGCATSGGSGSSSGSGSELGSGPYSFSQRDFPANGKCRLWDVEKKADAQLAKEMACEQLLEEAPKSGWMLRRSGVMVFLNRLSDQGKVTESHRYDGFTAEYLGPANVPK